MYRAVGRLVCGPVLGDKFKRRMVRDCCYGPLVIERSRAEVLKLAMDRGFRGCNPEVNALQEIKAMRHLGTVSSDKAREIVDTLRKEYQKVEFYMEPSDHRKVIIMETDTLVIGEPMVEDIIRRLNTLK